MDATRRRWSLVVARARRRRVGVADRRRGLLPAVVAVVLTILTVPADPGPAGAQSRSPAPKSPGTVVVDGCSVVLQPTRMHFTNCPGQDLSSANFSELDLRFANFARSMFVSCEGVFGHTTFCPGANFEHADLAHADAEHAVFGYCCGTAFAPFHAAASFLGASMRQFDASGATFDDLANLDLQRMNLTGATIYGGFEGSNLTGTDLSGAVVRGIDLSSPTLIAAAFGQAVLRATDFGGADLGGLSFNGAVLSARTTFAGSEIQYSNFTGTRLVPANHAVRASSPSGAVVKWRQPNALPGASPGPCAPASGSLFPVGVTTVQCMINGGPGPPFLGGPNTATGTFVVTVR